MGFKDLFRGKQEEKPLMDSDLKSWGLSHITKSLGFSWASLGLDTKEKIIDEVEKSVQKGTPVFKSIIKKAQVTILEKEKGKLSEITCLLNGSVITFFPKVKSSAIFPATIISIREVGNLFEAFAEIKVGDATLTAFLTDYLFNREKYVPGKQLDLAMAGVAFQGEPSKMAEQTFQRDGKPIKVSPDFAGIFPNNPESALYAAVGQITNKKTFTVNNEKLCSFTIKIINGQPAIYTDIIAWEKNITFPNKKESLLCNFWLQAYISKK